MEIMYANKVDQYFKSGKINGFYKDIKDLANYLKNIYGLTYDDEWTVKKYLNTIKNKNNKNIEEIINNLNIEDSVLDKKIKILSSNEFKLTLLAALLIENPNIYIFDYFEVGLSYKNRKMFVNLLRSLKKEEKTIIVVTNDIGFLYEVSDHIMVVSERKLIYNGSKRDLFNIKKLDSEPPIITFIRKANKLGANLFFTVDRKELIKDIYRSLR